MPDFKQVKNQVLALIFNILSWGRHLVAPSPPMIKEKADGAYCVEIGGPGGLDQLELVDLETENKICVGYNLRKEGHPPPYVVMDPSKGLDEQIHESLVLVDIEYFSVNYADVCIRWGLYESALRYVGWPIVPGFDFSGKITWVGSQAAKGSNFKKGDVVFGVSLFGSYSKKVLVPVRQLRHVPKITADGGKLLSQPKASSILAVAATALHAVALAKAWPQPLMTSNKAAMIHSAAGGVGSILIQICKARGYNPVVAIVGQSHKKDHCLTLGADFVIDKSKEDLWAKAEEISPGGFVAMFDANGVETLQYSYDHLCNCGSLVVYGMHTNLPKSTDLNPINWINVISKVGKMPRFDPMDLMLNSKSISGFNLSFFEAEHDLIVSYFNQISDWIADSTITVVEPTIFPITEIREAHVLIQSGTSKGKIVVSA